MNDLEELERRLRSAQLRTSKTLDTRIQALLNEADIQASPAQHWSLRPILRKRIWRGLAASAVAALLVLVLVLWPGRPMGQVSAAETLAEASRAVTNLRSVHIEVRMRTLPQDNFELIGLDYGFVPIEMWKEFGDVPRWRIEKPGRVVVMGGTSSVMLIRTGTGAVLAAKGGARTGLVSWLLPLLDVDQVLDSEVRLAQRQGSELALRHETEADGARKIVVSVEAKAQGDFAGDWLKNRSVIESDNRRVYRFAEDTKRLEGLQVYVHAQEHEVLVLEITRIEYNLEVDPALFSLAVPENAVLLQEPQQLADNERYRRMSPEEAARAFFAACANEDWEEALKFWTASRFDEGMKKYLGRLKVISIGRPFRSGLYPGWFVPYEIRLRSGDVKKFNLAVRNDNPAQRYVVDGGF